MKIKRLLFLLAIVPSLFGCKSNKNNEQTPEEQHEENTQQMLVLNTNSIKISEEKTYKLEVTVDPSLQKYLLFWSIENESVATVDNAGLVTGVKTGYTICTAQCGKYQVRCVVEVTPYVPNEYLSVSFEKISYTLNVNDTYTLNPIVKLGNERISNYSSSAEISDSNVISYSNNVITALAIGESDILITYSYQEYSTQQLLHFIVC